jgi:hypothetical protein
MSVRVFSTGLPMDKPPSGFARTLTPSHHIISTCQKCGTMLEGEVDRNHIQQEREHQTACGKPNRAVKSAT